MSDPGWKQFERRIAKLFGGKRRGADYTDDQGKGKSDIIKEGWSIECKLLSRPTWGQINDAVRQAERAAPNCEVVKDIIEDVEQAIMGQVTTYGGAIPIAIVKQKGSQDKDSIVAMRLETFMEWFG